MKWGRELAGRHLRTRRLALNLYGAAARLTRFFIGDAAILIGDTSSLAPGLLSFVAINPRQLWGSGVVACDRGTPGSCSMIKVLQQQSGISHIVRRVEDFLQVRERVAVILQIDLHASDIDIVHALIVMAPNIGERFCLVCEPAAALLGVDGPGPRGAARALFQTPDSTMAMASKSWLGISSLASASAIWRSQISLTGSPLCSACAAGIERVRAITTRKAALAARNIIVVRIPKLWKQTPCQRHIGFLQHA